MIVNKIMKSIKKQKISMTSHKLMSMLSGSYRITIIGSDFIHFNHINNSCYSNFSYRPNFRYYSNFSYCPNLDSYIRLY